MMLGASIQYEGDRREPLASLNVRAAIYQCARRNLPQRLSPRALLAERADLRASCRVRAS
jgi:hypothetical protein